MKDLLAFARKLDELKARKTYLTCVTIGYVGEYTRNGYETFWYVLLPHFGRAATDLDKVLIGSGPDKFVKALGDWERLEATICERWFADPYRMSGAEILDQSRRLAMNAGQIEVTNRVTE